MPTANRKRGIVLTIHHLFNSRFAHAEVGSWRTGYRQDKLIGQPVADEICVESPVRRREVGVLLNGVALAVDGAEVESKITA